MRTLSVRAGRGFTLIEMLLAVAIMALLAAVLVGANAFFDAGLSARATEMRNQIRYAQLRAMKTASVYGLFCDGTDYWMFADAPTPESNRVPLPGGTTLFVHLDDIGVAATAFSLYFDAYGRPYSAYTDATTNTPVSSTNPVNVVLTRGEASQTLSVTEETGFVP